MSVKACQIPFIIQNQKSGARRMDLKSLLQALIIAGITALASVFVSQQVVVSKIDALDEKVDQVSEQVEQIRKDFYVPRGRH